MSTTRAAVAALLLLAGCPSPQLPKGPPPEYEDPPPPSWLDGGADASPSAAPDGAPATTRTEPSPQASDAG
jgi:hypothetical protein